MVRTPIYGSHDEKCYNSERSIATDSLCGRSYNGFLWSEVTAAFLVFCEEQG
jgi:hypothetical protein